MYTPSSPNDKQVDGGITRRNVLIGIGASGLTAAAGSANAQASATPSSMQSEGCVFDHAEIDVSVNEILLPDLHDLVSKLVDQGQCPACGFLGFDVRLRGQEQFLEPMSQDARIFNEFDATDVPGIINASMAPQDPIPADEAKWLIPRVQFQFEVAEDIMLEPVNELIARLADLAGCLECGMNGLDVHFRGQGPFPEELTTEASIFQFDPGGFSGVADFAMRGVTNVVGR